MAENIHFFSAQADTLMSAQVVKLATLQALGVIAETHTQMVQNGGNYHISFCSSSNNSYMES